MRMVVPTGLRGAVQGAADRLGLRPAPGLPAQVHLSVTDRCFLPCLHCDIHRNRAPDRPTEDWLRFLDRLARWLGAGAVNFAGGEPLLRRDLEVLLARARDHGFATSFNTNGWLVTRERARRIAHAGTTITYVSLDGVREETVDRTRGRRGAFRRARAAVDHLQEAGGTQVILATILHGENAREIPALLDLVQARGLQLVVQPLYRNFGDGPDDPGWWRRSPLWPRDPAPVLEALNLLAEVRRGGGPVCNAEGQLRAMKGYFQDPERPNGLTCRAGHTDLAVDPRGNLRLCFFLDPVGTMDEDPEAVWARLRTLRRRWEVSRCQRTCNLLNCNFEEDARVPV